MAKKQILVVEDESIIAQDIKLSLQDLGYSVCAVVSSGTEAIKKAEENKPDLVLMDILLEGEMDGTETAEKIRSRFDIPVVYLTAYADEDIMERAKITEPYGYILKPFEERELHSNIEIALYKHGMENELKKRKNWLSTTLRSIGDAVIATDAEGHVRFMNRVAQNLTGWTQEDGEGKPLEEVFNIVNEETDEKRENPVTKVIRKGVVVGLANHTVLISKDGTRRIIDDSGAPIRDEKGNITGVVLVFRDITERRQKEKEIAEKNRIINMLMENSPDQFYVKDRAHRFIIINEAGAENLGTTKEDALSKTDADFFPKELAEEYYQDEEYVMNTGKSIVNKEEKTGERSERWNSTTKIPMYDEDGNIVGVMGINRDITEQKKAEKKLRESERKYRQVVENANEAILVIQDGQIKFFNPKAIEISGYSKEEITSKPFVEFIYPEDRKMVAERHLKRLKGEKLPKVYSFRFIDQKGNVRWLEINAVRINWEGELATLNFLTDITERKQAEQALRKSEQAARRFQKELTVLHEVSNELAMADTFDELCKSAVELGRSRLDFGRLGIWFIDKDEPEYIIGSFGTDENGQIRDERNIRMPLGEEPAIKPILEHSKSSVLLTNVLLTDQKNREVGRGQLVFAALWNGEETIGFLCMDNLLTQQPISERQQELITLYASTLGHLCSLKKTQEELRVSEKKFRGVAERSSDIIFIIDLKGSISYVSPAVKNITGYKPEEIVGKKAEDFLPESERSKFHQTFAETIKRGITERYRTKMLKKDGSVIFIEVNSSTIIKDEEVIGLQGVMRDITERKKLEKERQKVDKLESIGVLAGGIAHDFNNLLTGILGNLSLARMYCNRDRLSSLEKVVERLDKSEKASLLAKDLVQQLLTFSKGGEPIKEAASIVEILKETTEFALTGSNVKCKFSIKDELLPVEIDKGQISQVVKNLVINADQAMPTGGIIKIKAENFTVEPKDSISFQEGKYVKISVKDRGVGISEENLPKIFDPYFSTKEMSSEKGTGLGLAICHSIVKEHDGYITVESEVGVGTTFYVYLPASKKQVPIVEEKEDISLEGKGKILVMDDEEIVRIAAGDILKYIGYDVEFTEDGAEAVEMYKEAKESGNPFDAVILDLTVPGGMGGKETVSKLLQIDKNVKAIVSSGYSNFSIMSNFDQYGFSGVVAKPYNIDELSKVLHDVIEG